MLGHLAEAYVRIIVYGHERDAYTVSRSAPAPPRSLEDQYPAAATAAVALAQLHNHRPDSDWESEAVSNFEVLEISGGARKMTKAVCCRNTLRRMTPNLHECTLQ